MTDYTIINCTSRGSEDGALGEQGLRSGESTRLPPMCPGFDSRSRRYMWVEFVVGSRPCSEGLSPGSPVFLPPQKLTLLNSNSIRNTWPHKLLALNTTVSKQRLFIYLSIYLKYYYSHVHQYLQYG